MATDADIPKKKRQRSFKGFWGALLLSLLGMGVAYQGSWESSPSSLTLMGSFMSIPLLLVVSLGIFGGWLWRRGKNFWVLYGVLILGMALSFFYAESLSYSPMILRLYMGEGRGPDYLKLYLILPAGMFLVKYLLGLFLGYSQKIVSVVALCSTAFYGIAALSLNWGLRLDYMDAIPLIAPLALGATLWDTWGLDWLSGDRRGDNCSFALASNLIGVVLLLLVLN